MKVYIATSREIGEKCLVWAKSVIPKGFEFTDDMDECDIFISVMYEEVVSEKFIESKKGCYNIHPGILPQYRGSGCFSWAIINGDHSFGVTLHEMDTDIDHGAIIAIKTSPIGKYDTAYSLFKKGEQMIFDTFKQYFHRLLSKNYTAIPQDESISRMYYRKDLKKVMDLTRFAKAFHFPDKEQAYWKDSAGDKHYLKYEKDKR